MQTSNPALNDSTFENLDTDGSVMTLEGTSIKTCILLAIIVIVGAFAWHQGTIGLEAMDTTVIQEEGRIHRLSAVPMNTWGFILGGSIGGLILASICIFSPKKSPVLAPMYAVAEGLALGSFSVLFEFMYPGIVIQAVGCTLGTLGALLVIYMTGLIKATENFKLGVCAATLGIVFYYIASVTLAFFGVEVPLIHETGISGILFSVFVVIIAALNLVLDFDFIETGVEKQSPKYMEWYSALGLTITLVWLYLEFIKLLAKLKSK